MNHLKMSVYYTTIPKKKLELAVTGQTGPMQISYAQLKRQEQQNNDVFFASFVNRFQRLCNKEILGCYESREGN